MKLPKHTRLRIQRLPFPNGGSNVLVLQVGTEMNTGSDDSIPPSQQNKDYIHWRDATLEDITEGLVAL